ncbi:LOW QUALITY PROTEIN: hypothetical protein BC936DRAFT_139035, partial [Jimgerdemannia flammicorona]
MLNKRRSIAIVQPELDIPRLPVRWFHAVDVPISDPKVERLKKRTASGSRESSSVSSASTSTQTSSTPATKPKQSANWVAFSKRDSNALEKAYLSDEPNPKVAVNEDYLFEVDVTQRTITPVFWDGPVYEVRRATWFMQGDSSKWIPCEENLSEQIELGYCKYRPWIPDPVITEDLTHSTSSDTAAVALGSSPPRPTTPKISGTPGPVTPHPPADSATSAGSHDQASPVIEEKKLEKQWNLLGRYLEQYVIYTGATTAWLLSDSLSSKVTKHIFTRLTNNSNLGGTRLLRGYPEVEKSVAPATTSPFSKSKQPTVDEAIKQQKGEKGEKGDAEDIVANVVGDKEDDETTQTRRELEDYANEESEENERKVDHLVFVIHGKYYLTNVNVLRRTMKSAFSSVATHIGNPSRSNGIQVLPILWRQDITFGMAADEDNVERDMGMPELEDGQPTLDEITLEGVPNIRMIVSDVLLDVPLYMTPKYREQMMSIVAKEINRVYHLFVERNPHFSQNGKVSIYGHSLG